MNHTGSGGAQKASCISRECFVDTTGNMEENPHANSAAALAATVNKMPPGLPDIIDSFVKTLGTTPFKFDNTNIGYRDQTNAYLRIVVPNGYNQLNNGPLSNEFYRVSKGLHFFYEYFEQLERGLLGDTEFGPFYATYKKMIGTFDPPRASTDSGGGVYSEYDSPSEPDTDEEMKGAKTISDKYLIIPETSVLKNEVDKAVAQAVDSQNTQTICRQFNALLRLALSEQEPEQVLPINYDPPWTTPPKQYKYMLTTPAPNSKTITIITGHDGSADDFDDNTKAAFFKMRIIVQALDPLPPPPPPPSPPLSSKRKHSDTKTDGQSEKRQKLTGLQSKSFTFTSASSWDIHSKSQGERPLYKWLKKYPLFCRYSGDRTDEDSETSDSPYQNKMHSAMYATYSQKYTEPGPRFGEHPWWASYFITGLDPFIYKNELVNQVGDVMKALIDVLMTTGGLQNYEPLRRMYPPLYRNNATVQVEASFKDCTLV